MKKKNRVEFKLFKCGESLGKFLEQIGFDE